MLWFLCSNTSLLGLRAQINTLRSEKRHSHSGYNSKSATAQEGYYKKEHRHFFSIMLK